MITLIPRSFTDLPVAALEALGAALTGYIRDDAVTVRAPMRACVEARDELDIELMRRAFRQEKPGVCNA